MRLLFLLFIFSILLVAGCAIGKPPSATSPTPTPVPESTPLPTTPQPVPQPPAAQPKETGRLLVAVTDNPLEIDSANCDFELKKFEIELEGLELKDLNGSWLEIPFLALNDTNMTNVTNVTIDLVELIGIDNLVAQQVIEVGQYSEVRFKVQRTVMTQVIKIPVNLTNLTAFENLTANLTIDDELEEFDEEIGKKKKNKEFDELEELLEEKEEKEKEHKEFRKKLEEEGLEVEQDVKIPSNEFKLKHELEIEKDGNDLLEIDFDLRGSFRCADGKIIFLPIIDLESIEDLDFDIEFEEEFEERDGERRLKVKRELKIKDGEIELKTRHRMREFGLTELTNRIEVRQRAEELRKRGLEQEKEIDIEVDEGEAKIELEIAGKKQKFKLDTDNLEEAIAEVAELTGLSETEVLKLAEIEIEGKKQEEKEVEIEIENGKAQVKTEIKGLKTEFELEDTDLDKTIAEITERTGLTKEEVLEIAKIKVEKEDEIEKEDDDDKSGSSDGGKKEDKKDDKSGKSDDDDDDGDDDGDDDDNGSSGSSSGSSGSGTSGSGGGDDDDD